MIRFAIGVAYCFSYVLSPACFGQTESLQPIRALPDVSQTQMSNDGRRLFVDARQGDDAAKGTLQKPWQSIQHAVSQLKPGDTLYLRGGVYYEHVDLMRSGTESDPICIRSYPKELATIDGGLREFSEAPASCWEPLADGAQHEFVSTKTYPQFGKRPIVSTFPAAGWEPFFGKEEERPVVLGHFAESMIPLHGYRSLTDLRDNSMLWDVTNKFDQSQGVYCGPGLWFNRETHRIHIRLAHTTLKGLGNRHYRGPIDPRKVPLSISGPFGADVLRINGVKHVSIKDIAIRGGSGSPLINIYGADHITFSGVTVFGGAPGMLVKATSNLRVVHSAFRGLSAPWSSRASMKYRGTPSYRIITQRNKPESANWEFSYNEFTDDHDGIWIRYVKNLRFHHNYVDNFNDDGLEFGARKIDHELYIYQNLISRCLLTLTLHEMDRGESPPEVDPGSGVYITRNVIDLRHGLFKGPPKAEDPSGEFLKGTGVLCSDHGGPTWPNYYFYHNTVLRKDTAWRGYYGFGMGGQGTRRTTRRVFNNIFAQLEGVPGLTFASGPDDIVVDGNVHWGLIDGPKFSGDFFKERSRKMAFRRMPLPATWMQADEFADPKFAKLTADTSAPFDVSLKNDSPAIDAGVAIPATWLDPVRDSDAGKPDIGVLPKGHKIWSVGINGRITIR